MEQLIHNIYYLCGNFATIEDFKTTFVLWTVVCILNLRINLIRGRGGIVLSIYAIATPYLLNV